jgi:hypothetical protein
VTKPFSMRVVGEFVSRCDTTTRPTGPTSRSDGQGSRRRRRTTSSRRDREVELTPGFALLALLARWPGQCSPIGRSCRRSGARTTARKPGTCGCAATSEAQDDPGGLGSSPSPAWATGSHPDPH